MRAVSAATCSLTVRSSSGFTWSPTSTLTPAIDSALAPMATWALRFGSMRQSVLMIGRAETATVPRRSARWSRVRPVIFCSPCPRSPLIRPPSVPPTLPAPFAIWPVRRSVPLIGVVTVSASLRPTTTNGPRVSVQPMSALPRIWVSGLSPLPERLRGARSSMASRMAVSATAIGAVMVEVRVAGLSGGISTSLGGLLPATGKNVLSAHSAPANEPIRTTAPPAMRTTPGPPMTLRLPAGMRNPRAISPGPHVNNQDAAIPVTPPRRNRRRRRLRHSVSRPAP